MFITFEGIEGAGKSTIMGFLAEYMRDAGESVVVTREPGGSQLGRRLRAMLLDSRNDRISPQAELCLFLADRAQHIADEILPALAAGQSVLCDRYIDSTLAYQGYGRGMNIEELKQINKFAAGNLMPDLTFLLDLPVSTGLARAGERNRLEGTVISEGRFDSESLEFHERVRNGYRELAKEEPDRIVVINAESAPEQVILECREKLKKALDRAGSTNV